MSLFLIIPAAGGGNRLCRPEPKALVPLCGRPLLRWTLDALAPIEFERSIVAAPPERLREFEHAAGDGPLVVAGGATRAQSVRRAFAALEPRSDDLVVIHDAARPFVTAGEAAAVIAAAASADGAIAATPIVDTIKRGEAGRVVATVDRRDLYAAGTPQAFRAHCLARALASERDETDEAALCEALGAEILLVPVSRLGFKITTPEDLEVAEGILRGRRG